MERARKIQFAKYIALLFFIAAFLGAGHLVFAQETESSVDALNDEISNRKAEIDKINSKIDEYRSKINEYTSQTASLITDIEMIENQIAIAQLDVDATQVEIESQQLEVQVLEEKIRQEANVIDDQQEMIEEMIFELHRKSQVGMLEILFGSDNFGELFDELEQLESVNADLNRALEATKLSKENLEVNKGKQEDHLDSLVELESQLKERVANLDHQSQAKEKLIVETQATESQYRVLMSELRQERQSVTNSIASLQSQIEERLAESDNSEDSDPSLMTHPLPSAIMTARFHDPTYPFRHLWEHSGVDLAAPTGTPVRAAAPGIVAWTRTGRSYGNYVMIIHEDGFATLYAHLSGFNVTADDFVGRGDTIGFVGSTGFSTGPHLHFEVRLNGIPVDPMHYIVN